MPVLVPVLVAVRDDVVEEKDQKQQDGQQTRRIYGLIKLHLHNLRDCTVIIRCKIITSTMEISNCHNVTVKVESSATVATACVASTASGKSKSCRENTALFASESDTLLVA